MGIDELQRIHMKILRLYLINIIVLFLLYIINLIDKRQEFNVIGLLLLIIVLTFEVICYKLQLWNKKKYFTVMLIYETVLYSYFFVYITEIYIKGIIIVSFISVAVRLILYYDFLETYVRRLLIALVFSIPVSLLLIKMFTSYGDNYSEIFGLACQLLVSLILVLSIFEPLADAVTSFQEKLFGQRRLAESTTEAIEELKIQQDKINKVNELLGLQKLKLEAAYQTMHEMAIRDGLTGIYNRGHLNQIFSDLCVESASCNEALSVALFDIDHFKLVNDTYGHLFGDTVIVAIAKLAQEIAEKNRGIAARYGGEEFVIVFPRKNIEVSKLIIEEMKQCISGFKLNYNDTLVSVHVSVGITSYPETCEEPLQLLNHADWAMYYSKKNGRNRITVDSEEVREAVRMKNKK